ncbi:MAG: bifunctional 5,10-methylenetetrahydrofolate dehydrogenase/5,10-methenyltetrahydrofolate cyclohydrolase [Tissierella sp.]|nr:bifunctional 5,10-methylenetetrahydrofolate dehydrogenase/5,10-methenyltetrahydrofolate cyclohydrolase [Tissierella sp.]
MMKLLKGIEVSKGVKLQITNTIKELEEMDKFPQLGIIRVGNDPSDISYEKSIIKNCDSLGIKTKIVELDEKIDTDDLVSAMEELNNDTLVSGILVFRPLPKHIDEEKVRISINPSKDVDCMHPLNLEKIFEGDITGFSPCTPKAAMEILLYNDIPLEGKNVVVINRSMVVGKPLAMMLLEKNATVTICHSRTQNLSEITKNADIVMTGLGRAKFLDDKYFNESSIVIDIGVSLDSDGKISGDVDMDKVNDKISMVTPVPGGVGSVTTSILLKQVVDACKMN